MKRESCKGSSKMLDRFEALINARLRRSRPSQYQQLMESWNLSKHLRQQSTLAVNLMGPSIDAGADESAALEFAWTLLYPEPEKSPLDQHSLSGLISFEYDQAAALLLIASRQRGSLFKIEHALHIYDRSEQLRRVLEILDFVMPVLDEPSSDVRWFGFHQL